MISQSPHPGLLRETSADDETVLQTKATPEVVSSSPLSQKTKSRVSFVTPPRKEKPKGVSPMCLSWIEHLPDTVQPIESSRDNWNSSNCGHSHNSLPKLRLNKFYGDPLHWADWSSMFKSIVHDTNLSLNKKM